MDPPDGDVPAPASLNTITVTSRTGFSPNSVYTVTFNGGTSGTFSAVNTSGEPVGSGTFIYEPQGTQAHLRMTYPDFDNDYDDMTLIFTEAAGSGQPNNFTGTQVVSGDLHQFSGTFTY